MNNENKVEIMSISESNDLSTPIEENVSPYDPSFPIKYLYNGLKSKLDDSQKAADRIYRTVLKAAPITSETQKIIKKGVRYVVDLSEETLDKIETGEIKFEVTKAGKMTAQIKNGNQFGEKMPIKRETFRNGLNRTEAANALQMQALQIQLQEIADQISLIDQSVKEVLQGQQNDRIGLYYSGLRLFLESQSIGDLSLKNAVLVQALKTLTDASYQLIETMKSDISYLLNHEYESKKGNRIPLIDEKMTNINNCFEFIHQSALLRAAIYCQQNELIAMTTVLKDYSFFIETLIASNAEQLAILDPKNKGTNNSIWNTRGKLRIDVLNFAEQLNSPNKTLYIGLKED